MEAIVIAFVFALVIYAWLAWLGDKVAHEDDSDIDKF